MVKANGLRFRAMVDGKEVTTGQKFASLNPAHPDEILGHFQKADTALADQAIEAAANRRLSQIETDLMLQRLAASQEHFPLALEMASLEEAALRELDAAPMLEKSKEPRTQSS